MLRYKNIAKSVPVFACLASIASMGAIWGGGLSSVQASSVSSRCQKYEAQLVSAVYQTDTEITASKEQLQTAEERVKQLAELSQAGAVSQRQVDLAQVQLQKAKRDLAAAIARSKQARQQLKTLQNMPACTV
ncbi:TolC family protein [Pseudanabaena sp. PCC 6802]|uniref:TolC family protein n=1 Tax=Pseudanabaena sp. PCC 6802 TaxID=118173 RepID=UPI0003496B73|nr:TolC family protein [Pseudanabaena sp. PCC 6802]